MKKINLFLFMMLFLFRIFYNILMKVSDSFNSIHISLTILIEHFYIPQYVNHLVQFTNSLLDLSVSQFEILQHVL